MTKLRWLARAEPQHAARTAAVCLPHDWLTWQLARATSLEIFHTSHGRYETAAPIETFLPYTVKGRPALLAGYGCAPLAVFDMADLEGGKHVRGRTLAELGGGALGELEPVAQRRDRQREAELHHAVAGGVAVGAHDVRLRSAAHFSSRISDAGL